MAAGREVARLSGHNAGIFGGLAFSPDGKRAVSATGSEVKLWEIPSGREIVTLPVLDQGERPQGVAAVAFTPDGRRLLAAGVSGSVQAWDSAEIPSAAAVGPTREQSRIQSQMTPAGKRHWVALQTGIAEPGELEPFLRN